MKRTCKKCGVENDRNEKGQFVKGTVPKNKLNLVGKKFNRLTVVEEIKERGKNYKVYWLCVCDCGNKTRVTTSKLINGSTKTCGCGRKKFLEKFVDLTGKKIGMLTIIKKLKKRDAHRRIMWSCKCDCGKTKNISSNSLLNGQKSCGCLLDDFYKSTRRYNEHIYDCDPKMGFICGICGKKNLLKQDFYKLEHHICKKCFNKKSSKNAKNHIETMSDSYIKSLLSKESNLKNEDIPQPLVDLQREVIRNKRLLKELTS